PGVEIVLHFALFARELTGPVAKVFLRLAALIRRHGGAVLLELVLLGFERGLLILQIALARIELVADRLEGGLGLRRFLAQPAVFDITDLDVGPGRRRYGECQTQG